MFLILYKCYKFYKILLMKPLDTFIWLNQSCEPLNVRIVHVYNCQIVRSKVQQDMMRPKSALFYIDSVTEVQAATSYVDQWSKVSI